MLRLVEASKQNNRDFFPLALILAGGAWSVPD